MKGKSILIGVIALAASYPIATGDFRLVGLKYRVLAFAEIAAERAEGIGKDIWAPRKMMRHTLSSACIAISPGSGLT